MTYRIGIIGTGPKERTKERGGGFAIGRIHADAWAKVSGVSLHSACDINPTNLSAFVTDYHVTYSYLNYHEMLSSGTVDIVDVCTWPGLHSQIVIDAARAGVKAIYCEKPMCLSLEEADSMLRTCTEYGVRLLVSHQRRFDPAFVFAKDVILSGQIGTVLELHGRIAGDDADMLSWGTHWFDMFNFLMNDSPVRSVFAQVDCSSHIQRYGHYVEDAALVWVEYENGTRAYLAGDYKHSEPASIRVIGDKGMIDISHGARVYSENGVEKFDSPSDSFESSYVAAMTDLIASIDDGRDPVLSGRLARNTTEVIMAAYESANQRRKVSVPLSKMTFPLNDREEFKEVNIG